jgi:uncharacterized Fe-S cluster-containing radical SAM superfamily protein
MKTLLEIEPTTRVGWKPIAWADAVGCSVAWAYCLLNEGRIAAVKDGRATIITTPPAEYVASLPEFVSKRKTRPVAKHQAPPVV